MIVKNNTNNTLYIEELDMYLPYQDDEEGHYFDPDVLKKSKGLRDFIIGRVLDVIEYDVNERIEASIMYLREKTDAKPKVVEIDDSEIVPINLQTTSDNIEVRIHGIFLDGGGYAKVNRNLALKLDQAGIKVKIDPKRSQNQLKESELTDIKRLCKTQLSKNHIAIDSVIPTFAEPAAGKYRILYTTIESYTIPKQFLECCQLYQEIWCTSPWSVEILKKQVNKPVYLVPAGSDPELYTETGSKFDFRPNIKDFVFISVFGWSYRKGYDVLLKAYFEEFDASDNVSLLIASRYQSGTTRSHRNRIRDDINNIMKEYPNKNMPHVVRYSQVVPEEHMPRLYRSAHCFVLPSRGEGSGLPPVEASLCGLPVIMTNVSGQCFPPETLIETVKGAKPINKITTKDHVISHVGKNRQVIHKFERFYSGNIIRIKSYGNDDLLVTPEHPILVKKTINSESHFIPAKEISKGDYLLHPKCCTDDRDSISLSDFIDNEKQIEKVDGMWKMKCENRRSFLHFNIPTTIKSRKRKGRLRSYEVRVGSKHLNTLNKWTNSEAVYKKYYMPYVKMVDNTLCFPVNSITEERYVGYVYNLEVEKENSYIANGVCVHNCMYLRSDNAFLIEMDHLTKVLPGMFHLHYWDGQEFPALTSESVRTELRKAMRFVTEHYDEAKTRNKRLQKLIKEQFTWNNTANAAIARLRQINKEIKS